MPEPRALAHPLPGAAGGAVSPPEKRVGRRNRAPRAASRKTCMPPPATPSPGGQPIRARQKRKTYLHFAAQAKKENLQTLRGTRLGDERAECTYRFHARSRRSGQAAWRRHGKRVCLRPPCRALRQWLASWLSPTGRSARGWQHGGAVPRISRYGSHVPVAGEGARRATGGTLSPVAQQGNVGRPSAQLAARAPLRRLPGHSCRKPCRPGRQRRTAARRRRSRRLEHPRWRRSPRSRRLWQ